MVPHYFERKRCLIHDVDEAMIAYNIGGQIVSEDVDMTHPVMAALDEILHEMCQHRHPSDELVEEMHRRMEAAQHFLSRQASRAIALSN